MSDGTEQLFIFLEDRGVICCHRLYTKRKRDSEQI
jgi:hypothetical protein